MIQFGPPPFGSVRLQDNPQVQKLLSKWENSDSISVDSKYIETVIGIFFLSFSLLVNMTAKSMCFLRSRMLMIEKLRKFTK